jgi:RHS repeat-associated protein
VSGTDLDFLYDGWRAIEIRKTATQLPYFQSIFGNYLDEQVEADYNGGTPDATCTGAGDAAYGIQNNALFSVYAVTRPDKTINSAFEYDPYGYPTRLIDGNDGDTTVNFNGNDTRAAGIGSTFLHSYTGQHYDPESGLYYFKRRYYHPALGRFISRDPIGYTGGINIYAYTHGNPLAMVDPHGDNPVLAAVLALVVAVDACAYPQYLAAHSRYLSKSDKWRHCWVSCRISKTCGGIITEIAGVGYEIIDQTRRATCAAFPNLPFCDQEHGDLWDSLTDIMANQQCIGWESIIIGIPGAWIGSLCRQSCEDCCTSKGL